MHSPLPKLQQIRASIAAAVDCEPFARERMSERVGLHGRWRGGRADPARQLCAAFPRLQLNIQNLTDRRYFDQIDPTHMAHVAAGRTVPLATNFHF